MTATVGVTLVTLAWPCLDLSARAASHPVSPIIHSESLTAAPTEDVSPATGPGSAASRTSGGPAWRTATVPATGSMAAISWPAGLQPAEDTRVELRGVRTDGTVGEWVAAAVSAKSDPTPGARNARTGTDAVWLGASKAVQVRYPASLTGLSTARVEVIDPGTSPADTPGRAPVGSASAVSEQPTIITRAEWGADESLRNGCVPSRMSSLDGVVLHHDAGSNSYGPQDSAAIIRGFYAYHTRTMGWCDVGYNFIVDKYGQIFQGRLGSITENIQGAHARGFNGRTLGVSMLGNYMTATPTQAGIDAVVRVVAWKLDAAQLHGDATVTWRGGDTGTRYAAGSQFEAPVILGHQDLNFTDCPGANYYPMLGQIRAAVAQRQSLFADVTPVNPFRMNIAWMANEGISTGWSAAGERWYRPLDSVNRDAMAAFMYRLAGSPEYTAPATSPFTDLSASTMYYKEITWLASTGISRGWRVGSDTQFRPGRPVTRAAMAAFMARFQAYRQAVAGAGPSTGTGAGTGTGTGTGADPKPDSSPFLDVPTSHQFYDEITWLAKQGISTGWPVEGGAEYRPDLPVARDAMAAFMSRL